MSVSFNKVFGIGLSKTGTLSLNSALMSLGLNAKHLPRNLDEIEFLDAATDTPIARAYKELDRRYPGSKFILTKREEEEWIKSCHDFFGDRVLAPWMRELQTDLYGVDSFDQLMFRMARQSHHEDVLDYFSGRAADLLVMNICAGEGWEKLCPFLGVRPPGFPFPHFNSG